MQHRAYTRRVNSNGEDVAPSVCACYYKAPQKQADNSGGYVLDYFKATQKEILPHLESNTQGVVQCNASNHETRTMNKEQTDVESRRNT